MKNFLGHEVKKYEKTITVYVMPFGYLIEADKNTDDNVIEFYISHTEYGVKMFLFGVCNCDCDDAKQEKLVYDYFTKYMDKISDEYMSLLTNDVAN